MADRTAVYVDGKSTIPQTRAAVTVEWEYVDGKSGGVAVDEHTASGLSIPVAMRHYLNMGNN